MRQLSVMFWTAEDTKESSYLISMTTEMIGCTSCMSKGVLSLLKTQSVLLGRGMKPSMILGEHLDLKGWLKKIYNKEKRTAYEKETVWTYGNIYFGDALGPRNGRERVWDEDAIKEKLIELKTLTSRRSSVSDFQSLSSSELADLTEKMH
jgi:hypothetical protein